MSLKRPLVTTLGLTTTLLLPPQSAVGADRLLSETDFFESIPTVTAATRLDQQQRDLPAAVTLIDRAMIDASGAVNIADLFRLVPGFQVYHVNANKFGVVSHGQGDAHPGRLEVMIDGRSVYSAIVSTVDWRALGITLDDIDHIEVVRGPNVATHGSNAFMGAINIVTRQPLQEVGTRLSLTGGDLGTREYNLSHSGRIGDVALRFSAGFMKNEGHGEGQGEDRITDAPFSATMEDGGEISQLGLRAIYTPNLQDTLDLHLGISHGGFGMGKSNHPDEFADRDVDSNFQNLTWTRSAADGSQLKLQGYHNYTRYEQNFEVLISQLLSQQASGLLVLPPGSVIPSYAQISAATGIPEAALRVAFPNVDTISGEPDQLVNLGIEDGGTHRYDLELEYSGPLSATTRAIAGVGWRLDQLKSQPLIGRNSYVSEPFYRTFGNVEWKPSQRWTFNGGAMLEYNSLVGSRLSPRVAGNFHLNNRQTLRAGVGQAYRTPSLLNWLQFSELRLPSNGAVLDLEAATLVDLKPERIRSVELGYLQHAAGLNSTFDLRLFYEQVDDAISDFRNTLPAGVIEVGKDEVFENRNGSQWRNRGLEAQWRLRPRPGTLLNLSYGYLSVNGEHDRGSNDGNRDIRDISDRAPRHTLSLLASQAFSPGVTGSAAFYRVTGVNWFQGDNLPAHSRLDLQLAKKLSVGRYRASLALIAQNLLDSYVEFERNNDFDTRLFLRFNLNFN